MKEIGRRGGHIPSAPLGPANVRIPVVANWIHMYLVLEDSLLVSCICCQGNTLDTAYYELATNYFVLENGIFVEMGTSPIQEQN